MIPGASDLLGTHSPFPLVPAVLPSHEYCTHTLSHPGLQAANIFVNDDDSMLVTAIIDWQGASIRPLFETVMPDLVDIDTILKI